LKKIVVILGGGGILGRRFADVLHGDGFNVINADLKFQEKNLNVVDGITEVYCDLLDEVCLKNLLRQINPVDVQALVVAGSVTTEMLAKDGFDFPRLQSFPNIVWEQTLAVGLSSIFHVSKIIDELEWENFSLVTIASMYALSAPHFNIYEGEKFEANIAYSAAKAGVVGITRYLASYWAPRRIRCNVLTPGAIFNGHTDNFRKNVSDLVISGRMGDPQEIAQALKFLCSDDSSYVNGENLNVDGGFNAW